MANPCIVTVMFMIVNRQLQKELYSETAYLAFQNKSYSIYNDWAYREYDHVTMHDKWRRTIVHVLTANHEAVVHERQLHNINHICQKVSDTKVWYVDSVIVDIKEYDTSVNIMDELQKVLHGSKQPPFCSLLNSYINNV